MTPPHPFDQPSASGAADQQPVGADPESVPATPLPASKPSALHVELDTIPGDLVSRDRWVCWKWTWKPDKKKWDKPPYQVDGRHAASTDPATWTTFNHAVTAYDAGGFDGIGFVLTEDDDLVAIDLDHCVDDGAVEPWALDAVRDFDSYAEISPSGHGIRIITRGKLPSGARKRGNVEIYETARYVTITGATLNGSPVAVRQAQIDAFHSKHLSPVANATPAPVAGTSTLTDSRILELARNAANSAKFLSVYNGDNSHTADGSASAGDLSLISMLAFYTRDPGQLDRLFRGSGRMRDKWDRPDYRERTITAALDTVTETYEAPANVKIVLPGQLVDPDKSGGTLAELLEEEIEPIRFVVHDLIPEGFTILAGKPKLGKSWLALLVALMICGGRSVLAHRTEQGEVLFISLEDGKGRLQSRVRDLDGHHLGKSLSRFHYRTTWPTLTTGGIDELEQWMVDHPDTRLIVIDTFGKIRGALKGKDKFQEEYELAGRLQTFATSHRVAMIVVHHTRKQGADDWLETVSGTQAITGAADAILGLFRERGQMDATLRLVSRDIEEKDLALRIENNRWESMGDASLYRQSVERTAVLDALKALGEGSASDLAPLVDKSPANVSKMLVGLFDQGMVEKVRRGVYSLKNTVDRVEPVETIPTESTETTQSTVTVDQEPDWDLLRDEFDFEEMEP